MNPFDAARVRATCLLLQKDFGRFRRTFDAALAERSPSLARMAARLEATHGIGVAAALVHALASRAGDDENTTHADWLAVILNDRRVEPSASAILGQIFMASLGEVLPPTRREAALTASLCAYVELVEATMASRWNRLDLVA